MIEKHQKQKPEPNVPTAMQRPSNIRHRQRQNLCRAFRLHTNLKQIWMGFGLVLTALNDVFSRFLLWPAFSRTGVFLIPMLFFLSLRENDTP